MFHIKFAVGRFASLKTETIAEKWNCYDFDFYLLQKYYTKKIMENQVKENYYEIYTMTRVFIADVMKWIEFMSYCEGGLCDIHSYFICNGEDFERYETD